MITLHDVYEQGSNTVKAAVLAFGARHPIHGGAQDAEPDWKTAERHFTHLIEVIMGTATPLPTGSTATVQRAEREAVAFLLAVNRADYRCPICVKRQRSPR